MEYALHGDTYILRLDKGEELLESLGAFARKEGVRLASVSGLGAVGELTVGVYKPDERHYCHNDFEGYYEIVSLTGTIDEMHGEHYAHLHMSAGDELGRVVGGHLNRAVVSATAELRVRLLPGTVDREKDEDIGLNLLRF